MPTPASPASRETREPERSERPDSKRALLLVPEFPYDSFWSFRYILRLIGRKATFPPLGLLAFAGYLPESWELELVDLNVGVPSDSELRRKIAAADVVFASAMSIQKRSLVRVLEGPARGTGTPVVLGGPLASSYREEILHPTSESDRTLHEALDVLVWGEAGGAIGSLMQWLDGAPTHEAGAPRLLIPEAVARVEPGSREYLNDRSIFLPLDDVPLPRWDLVRVSDYESMMIQTTAGCPFRCDFCDIVQFNGGFNRPKPPAVVRRELEAILATGFRGGVFSVDDNFIGSPEGISAVLDAMIDFQHEHGYPFAFLTQASVNLGTPKLAHLVEKMRLAGFQAVFLGIENPDPDALRQMNKKQNIKVDVPGSIRTLQASGIEVFAGFILGGDEDTPSTVDRIVEFVKRTRIFTAMTGMLTPVPFTPLYERLKREGRLRQAEFTGNNTDDAVQLEPRRMSAAELETGIREILSRLFNSVEIYRRAYDTVSTVRHHLFAPMKLDLGYLKGAAASVWMQGIARLDRRYFALLWSASRLDVRLGRASRREARGLGRLARRLRDDGVGRWLPDAQRVGELAGLAQEYLVRFRPDLSMAEVKERIARIRERAAAGRPTVADVRMVCEEARRYFEARARQHRFPGIKLKKAFEAAIRGLHYERVMSSIVR